MSRPALVVNYKPIEGEDAMLKGTMKKVSKAFLKLNCIVASKMAHIRPMGASVHYAGTLPIAEQKTPYTASKYNQSHDFPNLYFVDGTTFPFLPAKQLTFTMMANAVRVAECAF